MFRVYLGLQMCLNIRENKPTNVKLHTTIYGFWEKIDLTYDAKEIINCGFQEGHILSLEK